MKDFLLISALLILLSSPFLVTGLIIIDRTNKAYDRGYQAGIDSMSIDKQCAAWLFNANLKDVKQRICKK